MCKKTGWLALKTAVMWLLAAQATGQPASTLDPNSLPPSVALQLAAGTRTVSQPSEFISAIGDNSVTAIQLLQDITLTERDWQEYGGTLPLLRTQKCTIYSAPDKPGGYAAIFNVTNVHSKIRILPGAQIHLSRVLWAGAISFSSTTVYGIEMLAPSPEPSAGQHRAVLSVSSGYMTYALCLPGNMSIVASALVRRPPELPGVQRTWLPPSAGEPCFPEAPPLPPQYDGLKQLCFADFAVEGMQAAVAGGLSSTNYLVHVINVTAVCLHYISMECVLQYGVADCLELTGRALTAGGPASGPAADQARAGGSGSAPGPGPQQLLPDPAQPGGAAPGLGARMPAAADAGAAAPPPARGGGEGSHVRAEVVVPATVVAGTLVLLALAAGAVLWARRRRAGSCSTPPPSTVVLDLQEDKQQHGHSTPGVDRSSSSPGAIDGPGKQSPGDTAALAQGGRPGGGGAQVDTMSATNSSAAARGTLFKPAELFKMVTPSSRPTLGVQLELRWGVDVVVQPDALLGAGSFGRVVVGTLAGYPGEVAVKLLKCGNTRNWKAERQCEQEVGVLSRCCHPNVVTLLGACLDLPHLFLVMELMDQSLEQLLRAQPDGALLPMDQVLGIAIDVAQGLAYLHPTVTHRDLKPANVLLDRSGTAKLSDFGLARLRTSVLPTATPEAGTVPYMAPECFEVDNFIVSPKADIYSFGVMLWECLSGKAPWRGHHQLQVVMRVTHMQHRLPLHDIPPDRCSPKLRKLLVQCWDADPRRRPSADEVLKMLLLARLQLHRPAHASAVDAGEEEHSDGLDTGGDDLVDSLRAPGDAAAQAVQVQVQVVDMLALRLDAPPVRPASLTSAYYTPTENVPLRLGDMEAAALQLPLRPSTSATARRSLAPQDPPLEGHTR